MLKEMSKCLCVNIVAYDYRGYGESKFESLEEDEKKKESDFKSTAKNEIEKKLTEQTVNSDLETIYAYYCLEKKLSPSNIFLYGRSLGTAPSTHLASILSCGDRSKCIAKLSCER